MAAVDKKFTKFNRSGRGRNKQVLRYPLKMFAAGTDYLQIDMLDYTPVAERGDDREVSSGPDANPDKAFIKKTITTYSSYTKNPRDGFRRNSNKQPLGTILLPIPSNVQDGNSVNYTDDSMNSLVGAGLGGVEGIMTQVPAAFKEGGIEGASKKVFELSTGALDASGLTLANAQNLITKYFAGQALSLFGGNVSINLLLAPIIDYEVYIENLKRNAANQE